MAMNSGADGCGPRSPHSPTETPGDGRLTLQPSRGELALAVLIPGAILAIFVVLFWDYEVDDAFILLRYARNLAAGHGLAFNPGGPPVEGYSDFLLVVFGALLLRAGVEPLLVVKVLCSACALASLPLTHAAARRLGVSFLAALLGSVLLALSAGLALWTVSGLETSLFMLQLLAAVLLLLREELRSDLAAALLLVAAALTRPEAPVYLAGLAAVRLVRGLRSGAGWRQVAGDNAPWLLTFSVVWGGYFAFRYAYFGVLLPLPVYFKQGVASASLLQSTSAVFVAGWWPILVVAAAASLFRLRPGSAYLLVMPVVALAAYSRAHHFVAGSVGTMAFHDRYFIPILPYLVILVAMTLDGWWHRSLAKGRALVCLVATLLCGWQLFGPAAPPALLCRLARDQSIAEAQLAIPLAAYVNQRYGPQAEVALGDVGRSGYLIKGAVYDLFGLISHDFTQRFRRDVDAYLDHLVAAEPDLFVLVGEATDGGWAPQFYADQHLMQSPAFHASYQLTRTFGKEVQPEYFFLVFERRRQDRSASPEAVR